MHVHTFYKNKGGEEKTENTNVDKEVEKLKSLCTTGIKRYSYYGKTVWWFLKTLKIELSNDPETPVLVCSQKKKKK